MIRLKANEMRVLLFRRESLLPGNIFIIRGHVFMPQKSELTLSIDENIVLQYFIDRENGMETVKLSPKFQIVIPKKIRRSFDLKPGQKIQVIPLGHRIELIPERKVGEMKGFLKGISTALDRERDRI